MSEKVEYYDQVMSDYQMKVLATPEENKTSIYNCQKCPLAEFHKPLSLDNVQAPLMVIGKTPEDVSVDSPQGMVLHALLEEDFQVNPNHIYYTSALKCVGTTEQEHIINCHHHLVSEILYNQPYVIVALGYDVAAPFLEEMAISDPNNSYKILVPGYAAQLNDFSGMMVVNEIQDVLGDERLQNELVEHLQYALSALQNLEEPK